MRCIGCAPIVHGHRLPSWLRRARKRPRGNPSLSSLADVLGRHLYKVADAVIEAESSVSRRSMHLLPITGLPWNNPP
jgi:hypothetical protein